MNEENKLLIALQKLDPDNDAHWTQTGAPMMSVLHSEDFLNSDTLTRKALTMEFPDFNRDFAADQRAAAELTEEKVGEAIDKPRVEVEGDVLVEKEIAEDVELSNEVTVGELQEKLAKLRKVQADLSVAKDKAIKAFQEAQKKADKVQLEMEALLPPEQDKHVSNAQAYLKSQKAEVEKRFQRRKVLAAKLGGVDLGELDNRSPIDKAYAAKPNPQMRRPVIPLKDEKNAE